MPQRPIDLERRDEDGQGNNIAVMCPNCDTVYIVSEFLHGGRRRCPTCEGSEGRVRGGSADGTAEIEWNDDE
jgi:Zn finger protein HypA/HybF involved in hydrogenase expression